jgi:hypothetical protein
MQIAKAGNIHNFCHPNSLFTLQEYLVSACVSECLGEWCCVGETGGAAPVQRRMVAAGSWQHPTVLVVHTVCAQCRTTMAARRRRRWGRS